MPPVLALPRRSGGIAAKLIEYSRKSTASPLGERHSREEMRFREGGTKQNREVRHLRHARHPPNGGSNRAFFKGMCRLGRAT